MKVITDKEVGQLFQRLSNARSVGRKSWVMDGAFNLIDKLLAERIRSRFLADVKRPAGFSHGKLARRDFGLNE